MINGLKPYPSYRDSGVPWLGKVPLDWSIRRAKTSFRLRTQKSGERHGLELLSIYTHIGVRPRKDLEERGNKATTTDDYWIVKKGDIISNKLLAWMGAIAVSHYDGVTSPAYDILQPRQHLEPDYYHYLFRTGLYLQQFKLRSRGIMEMRLRLYFDQLGQIPIIIPPISEQSSVVRFLNHAERPIKRYIRAKQELIKLLEEQKQAIIHRAVTRGLDPDIRLTPSGVEWFGEVPEHWEVVPLKRRVRLQEGPGIMAADFRASGVPLLRISCTRGDVATIEGCNYLDPEMVKRRWSHFTVHEGDYLLSASASTGAVVFATKEVAGSIPYTGIIRLWSGSGKSVMPFVELFMGSRLFQDQIDLAKSGVGIEHFGPTHLKRMVIALPPPDEQWAIVRAVKEQTASFANAIASAKREIDLLREYRTRLVADVVTGKLDVREAVANLPAEAEESELPLVSSELDEEPEGDLLGGDADLEE